MTMTEPTMPGYRRDLRALPKAELHLHISAAMRPATLTELAEQAGLTAPDPRGFTTFTEFQQVFAASHAVSQTRPGKPATAGTGAGRGRRRGRRGLGPTALQPADVRPVRAARAGPGDGAGHRAGGR
jgi:hypothetical protein